MKRIKAINGYTIFQATARDEKRYNVREGMYYIYFSSDIRDFGIANSYSDFDDIESLEEAIEICGGNHAIARELCESYSTAVSYEDVERAEELLDSGLDLEDVERILFLDDAEEDEEAIEHDC